MNFEQIKEKVNRQLIRRETLKVKLSDYEFQKAGLEVTLRDSEKAREIIQIERSYR